MSGNIEENYQKLANFIIRSISGEWTNAWIEVEIKEDFESVIGRYQKPGDDKLYGFKTGEDVLSVFRDIREIISKPGHSMWSKAKFSLDNEGNFDMNFTYPD